MKKIVFILFALSLFNNVYATDFHKIYLKENKVTRITGDRLKEVKNETNVWEINLKEGEEVFQLKSENTNKVNYTVNGDFVYFEDTNNNPGYKSEIPYQRDNHTFYNSARLCLKKDALPVTISVDGKIIATFQLKKKYQNIGDIKARFFNVGDTLELNENSSSDDDSIPISSTSFSINNVALKNNVISEDIFNQSDPDSIKRDITVTVVYNDNRKDFKTYKNIVIKRNNDIPFEEKLRVVIPYILYILGGIVFVTIIILLKLKKITQPSKRDSNKTENDSEVDKNQNHLNALEAHHEDNSQNLSISVNELQKEIQALNNKIRELECSSSSQELPDRISDLETSEKEKLNEIKIFSNENSQ